MPYKDKNSKEAKASSKRRYEKYRMKNREKMRLIDRERRKKDPDYRARRLKAVKKYSMENREKYLKTKKSTHLKKLYGISNSDYDLLLRSQNGVCAICFGINQSKRRLAVDHNHITKKVRALLCDKCNRGLGFFNDNALLLTKAVEYIQKHG